MTSIIRSLSAVCIIAVLAFTVQPAKADGDGLIVKSSDFDVVKTLNRLGIALERAGINVFSQIKHNRGAEKVGMTLAPTETMIFGNPKLGTPLMQSNPAISLDLPLR